MPKEASNSEDPFAVAVIKGETIVGHVSRMISAVCAMFIRRGGLILCPVTGSRCYSEDLSQGGLEIPCAFNFCGNKFSWGQIFVNGCWVAKIAIISACENFPLYHMLDGNQRKKEREQRRNKKKEENNKIEIFAFDFLDCEEKSGDSGVIFCIRIAKGFLL